MSAHAYSTDNSKHPRTLLDAAVARQYCHTETASVTETDSHVIISLSLDRDPDDNWIQADDWLAPMVQARADLPAGDLRLLYLGWLLGTQWADEDDHFMGEKEPTLPTGLRNLSEPLLVIADFLEIDQDLLAVAAQASPPREEPTNEGLAEWIAGLPAAEKDTLLTKVADGDGTEVQALLLRRFRGREADITARSSSARTASELLAAADQRAIEREKAAELRRREEQARKAAAKAAKPRSPRASGNFVPGNRAGTACKIASTTLACPGERRPSGQPSWSAACAFSAWCSDDHSASCPCCLAGALARSSRYRASPASPSARAYLAGPSRKTPHPLSSAPDARRSASTRGSGVPASQAARCTSCAFSSASVTPSP